VSDLAGAERLLGEARATQEANWLAANLLTAAAVGLVLPGPAVIVGGTAEAYWTGRDVYHPTDLDVWTAGPVHAGTVAARALAQLGFTRDGRHWLLPGLNIPVEFPSGPFAGSLDRLRKEPLGPGAAVEVIGLDDLYLDRVRQATANTNEQSVEFTSALSVAAHRYDAIDWRYVSERIASERKSNEMLGREMDRRNRRIRAVVRRRLTQT
jgi:hypothetical protein